MILTRNKIFFGVLVFGSVVNLLIFFNVDLFYISTVITFIFLIIVPGLLLTLMLKIRKLDSWEYLIYFIGLSTAFLMFMGLFVNWTLPYFGIAEPLSKIPLLISLDVLLLVLWFIAYFRNKDLFIEVKSLKLSSLDNTFFIVSLFFPLLSIIGAITLNNGGPNYITLIMFSSIAVYFFLAVFYRDRLNKNIYPFSILMITLALLFSVSLRSWYVSGWDIYQEYYVFQLAKDNLRWSMTSYNDAYNACLSITVLPTVLSSFLRINDNYVFKLLFQVIFGFISVGVFVFLKKFALEIWAYIASFFFISQSGFFVSLTKIIRQEMALLFFVLVLVSLFSKNIGPITKKILFIIFGFSIVVSHYTTAYISIALFLFTYLITLIFRIVEKRKSIKTKNGNGQLKKVSANKKKYYLSGTLVLVLIVFTILWYAQLTKISSGLMDFTNKTIQNMSSISGTEFKEEGLSFSSQWNIFHKPEKEGPLLQDYIKEASIEYKNKSFVTLYPLEKYESYKPAITELVIPFKINEAVGSRIYPFIELIKKTVKIFIVISSVYILFFELRKRRIDIEYIMLCFIGIFAMLAMLILPAVTLEYSLERMYQQTLAFLSLFAVLGGYLLFRFIKEKGRIFLLVIIFIIYYLFFSGVVSQVVGGSDASLQLNNFGSSYRAHYAHESEVLSAKWLRENYNGKSLIYADKLAAWRLLAFGRFELVFDDVLPSTIDTDAYVYLDYRNTVLNLNFKRYKAKGLSYNYPIEFLEQNKNLIYSNGGSKVFK